MSHNGSTNAWRTPGKAEAFAGPPAPAGPEPEVDERFSVLVDAPRWTVVAKSGNLPCHPGGRYRRHTLERLLEERAGFPSVHFVSRLDRETSGCVLVAKDPEAAGAFGKAMMARRLRKAYLCLVRGAWTEPAGPDGWTDAFGWIRPAGDAVVHKYRVFTRALSEEAWRSGDPSTAAHTRFRPAPWSLLSPAPPPPGWTLLECVPVTGRTHQIRATLRGLGLEVGGDVEERAVAVLSTQEVQQRAVPDLVGEDEEPLRGVQLRVEVDVDEDAVAVRRRRLEADVAHRHEVEPHHERARERQLHQELLPVLRQQLGDGRLARGEGLAASQRRTPARRASAGSSRQSRSVFFCGHGKGAGAQLCQRGLP